MNSRDGLLEYFLSHQVVNPDISPQIQATALGVFAGNHADLTIVKGGNEFIAEPFRCFTADLTEFDFHIGIHIGHAGSI